MAGMVEIACFDHAKKARSIIGFRKPGFCFEMHVFFSSTYHHVLSKNNLSFIGKLSKERSYFQVNITFFNELLLLQNFQVKSPEASNFHKLACYKNDACGVFSFNLFLVNFNFFHSP